MTKQERKLDQPRNRLGLDLPTDAFGAFAEAIARFMGTGRFLFWQTVLVICWIALNALPLIFRWDPYPFILLNLAFSVQAAYAAPLILLAQNRQDDRDRVGLRADRAQAARTNADTEFLARELIGLRLAVETIAQRGELIQRELRLLSEQEPKGPTP